MFSFRQHRALTGALMGVLVGVAVFFALKAGVAGGSRSGVTATHQGAEQRSRSIGAFAVPIASQAWHEALLSALKPARVNTQGDEASDLAAEVIAFAGARWSGAPERYPEYCGSLGLFLRNPDELARIGWDVRGTVREYLGEEAASALTDEIHARCLEASDKVKGGRQRIVGVSGSLNDWEIVIGKMVREDPIPPQLTGSIGTRMRRGIVGNVLSWWSPEKTYVEQMNEHGSVVLAQVGFIAEFGDGKIRPVGLTFFLREPDRRWIPVGFYSATSSQQDRDFVRIEF